MVKIKESNSPSTPVTSRSGFMRYRRTSTPHPLTLLRKPGIAQQLKELQYEEQNETSSSSIEADTTVGSTSQISDDSGIDVSQDNDGAGHRYFLRRRYK
ncbi:hypothetical protein KR054_005087 [Drosophila jambulina]|nr:hypothetical protein KR054_005087 [Drosophila jambulina]